MKSFVCWTSLLSWVESSYFRSTSFLDKCESLAVHSFSGEVGFMIDLLVLTRKNQKGIALRNVILLSVYWTNGPKWTKSTGRVRHRRELLHIVTEGCMFL